MHINLIRILKKRKTFYLYFKVCLAGMVQSTEVYETKVGCSSGPSALIPPQNMEATESNFHKINQKTAYYLPLMENKWYDLKPAERMLQKSFCCVCFINGHHLLKKKRKKWSSYINVHLKCIR